MEPTTRRFIDPTQWSACRMTVMNFWMQKFQTDEFPPGIGKWRRTPQPPFQTVYTGPHHPLAWDLGHGNVLVSASFPDDLKETTGVRIAVYGVDVDMPQALYEVYTTATEKLQPGIIDMLGKYGVYHPSVLHFDDVYAIVASLGTLIPQPA